MITGKLIGPALDWAVAKCEGVLSPLGNVIVKGRPDRSRKLIIAVGEIEDPIVEYTPSTDWAQGGPVIEREDIIPYRYLGDCYAGVGINSAERHPTGSGPTLLIAAMRCFVASKLGDEVELPEELK